MSDPEINYGSLSMINYDELISQTLKDGIPPEQPSSVTVSFEVVVALPSMDTSVENILELAFRKVTTHRCEESIVLYCDDVDFLAQLPRRLETTLESLSDLPQVIQRHKLCHLIS